MNTKHMHKSSVPDYFLLGVSIFLLMFGIIILASVSAAFSFKKFDDTAYLLRHQILMGLIPGLILGFILYKIDLSLIKKWAPRLFLFNLFLLIAVFLPILGSNFGTASSWIYLGIVSFQPAEFLKLTFILYLAAWLTTRTDKTVSVKNPREFNRTLVAFLLALAIVCLLLILQPDVGTLAIIAVTAVAMYFSTNLPLVHTFLIFLIGSAVFYSMVKISPYRLNRLLVFLNSDIDPMGIGYQMKQALIAIGSGGVAGVGLGLSIQKHGFLPQSISDSIFAVFSEETGFIGAFFLIFLFLVFAWRGFKIAKESKDKFCQLVALGITVWIISQTFVNIGAMIGMLPLTGVPLPFISYGGSALVAELAGLGILLNISKKNNQ